MENIHKYPRTYHLPFSPEIHSDDKVHKNPEYFIRKELVITEKLDGGNTLLHKGKVYARSVSGEAKHESFSFIKNIHSHKTIDLDLYIYGENLQAIHSIEYQFLPDYFFVFAIRDEERWYSWIEVVEWCKLLDIHLVPVHRVSFYYDLKKMEEDLNKWIKIRSEFGLHREGFVIRVLDSFKINEFEMSVAKYVRKGHIQSTERWETNWKENKLKR